MNFPRKTMKPKYRQDTFLQIGSAGAVLSLLFLANCAASDLDWQEASLVTTGDLRYNEVQQKSSHNSFQRHEGLLDQLVYHRIRSVELDIYRGKFGRPGLSDDWYVYHIPFIDTGTSCDRLSNCLQELKVFDQQQPYHEIVTVWLDIKDGWGDSQTPAAFDALVSQYIDKDDILKPSDLFAACPGATSLKQTVVGSCRWPTLDSLRGKWMFVLTNGAYSNNRPDRVGFSTGTASNTNDVDNSNRIFLNQGDANNPLSRYIHAQRLVSRRYVVDTQNDFNSALSGLVHHVATNKVNFHRDSWSKTHNSAGWPFKCITSCGTSAEEEVVIGIQVNSEDIWDRGDHFHFLHQTMGTLNGRWSAAVNSASSHIDQWAKGCVMARASTASDSPYFAVCRPADNKKLRVQYRDNYGSNSSANDTDIAHADGLDQPNLTYVKMDVYNGGKCAAGFGSQDGERWTRIATRCFNHTLVLQGIAASSHGNAEVKHLFTNLSYWGNIQRKAAFTESDIGTVRSARAFDGSFP
ncbi:MAG: Ca2+-dependent phosphoinositide-specific phospholipase C [Proteobacteria bacterium]|nr:Ca2+-dependent phosphoinositide-specific phospholipase C [Pseudomonadota bacterium]